MFEQPGPIGRLCTQRVPVVQMIHSTIVGSQPHDKAAMFQYNRIFSQRIYPKIEFGSQRREMLLFLTTNMAAVTSHANQQSTG